MELEIPLNKLPYLMKMGYITTGELTKRGERKGINSIRLRDEVPGAWISSVHMVTRVPPGASSDEQPLASTQGGNN